MIRPSFIVVLLFLVVCSFCGKEFITLGRHSWRCKQRIQPELDQHARSTSTSMPVLNSPFTATTSSNVKCSCGKICKGKRGLKMHLRNCRIVNGLNEELIADLQDQFIDDSSDSIPNDFENSTAPSDETFPTLKKGINLPRNDSEWSTANDYFKIALQSFTPITSQDINTNIRQLNETIYNYFSGTYGYTKTTLNTHFAEKYKDQTAKELKKSLKILKKSNNDLDEIKYVSRLLRDKLRNGNKSNNDQSLQDHDHYINKNFWGYVKNIFNKRISELPTFDVSVCKAYFSKVLSSINPNKLFVIPTWIPCLPTPDIPFNLDPPTYEQITKVIRKMKTSGSPCPLDQISVISFKRCPILRTYLTEIIRQVWVSGSVPTEWKKACTILIHKKGSTDDPANFRPITLESIPLKVLTSCLRNSMFSFLAKNKLIEHNIQKGFTANLSGTIEHTAQMANIINKARTKQHSLVITLLDLKNAFGEVHHNLIQSVLSYHHIPDHIKDIVKSLYTDFNTSIITSKFSTPFIPVSRGVLQGDCLSPLLFNMCFNTFIQHIKAPKYRQFGFSIKSLNPIHWFQFADDAAVVSGLESENQHLLNRFSLWCQWSDMIIRVDKCSTFGIKKSSTKSIQYLPKLIINNDLVPTVKIGESFKYLGRYFDFDMSNMEHKTELINITNDLMTEIDTKNLHPKNKILLYSRYVLSKVSWHFTVADLSKTWVTENIDNIVSRYIRKWLEIPVSGTLSNVFLPINKFGLSIIPPSIRFTQCQVTLRKILKNSPNDDIQQLWRSTAAHTNIQYDAYKSTKRS